MQMETDRVTGTITWTFDPKDIEGKRRYRSATQGSYNQLQNVDTNYAELDFATPNLIHRIIL